MISQLHYISQEKEGLTHLEAIENALKAGCRWIQLRVKKQAENIVRENAFAAKDLCDRYGAKLIVNDFPHIAKEVCAYGVHVGLTDMPVREVRRIVGKELIIGGTANTLEHIRLRINEGADYVGLGPFRFTKTKENLSPILGLEGYQTILKGMEAEGLKIPLIAIGAISVNDIEALLNTGVFGVAISGSITEAENRTELVREIYEKLNRLRLAHF